MSIDQIPPQGAPFVYDDPDGNQRIDPDWYLFLYNLWISTTSILQGGVSFPDAVKIAMADIDAIGADVANVHGGGGGGTGTVTHTSGALVNHALTIGTGVSVDDIKTIAAMTDGQLVVGATGADPAPKTITGGATLSAAGVLTVKYVRGAGWTKGGFALSVPAVDVAITAQQTGTIRSAKMIGIGGTGSAVVDVWKSASTTVLPTVANTITAAALPTLSAAVESLDTTLTGWTTSVTAGDTFVFHLVSTSTFTGLTVILEIS